MVLETKSIPTVAWPHVKRYRETGVKHTKDQPEFLKRSSEHLTPPIAYIVIGLKLILYKSRNHTRLPDVFVAEKNEFIFGARHDITK